MRQFIRTYSQYRGRALLLVNLLCSMGPVSSFWF